MPRFALKLEYDGVPFCGWQRQKGGIPSVQGALETALARVDTAPDGVIGAGRTDAGVHALAQVGHVDLTRDWDPFRLGEALNYHLKPAPVAILDVAQVDDSFHARFSAQGRRYVFRLICRRAPLTLEAGRLWQVKRDLDIEAMRAGAAHLLGRHDFTTFRSTMCQAKSPIKTLDRLDVVTAEGPAGPEIRFDVRARSFLHNQVRSLVGTLERVGAGVWSSDDVADALVARDRAACGPVSPPQGLYLAGVDYDADPFA